MYSQLIWSQYKIIIRLDSQDKIDFYIAETVKNNWTVRQLERQVYSSLYERLLLSNDKLPENQKQIFASQYELYLPTEKQLLDEVNKELESFEEK
ncbi:hypothetical protein HZP16_13215 [Elizabethkingia anophelis]|nr:hypothetical protein [Elizabethkingia anophelis]